MKTTKRIITLALALILVLALAVPAFAATETGYIKVEGTGGTEYKVYKIFDIEKAVGDGYKYKLAAGWETFTAPGYFSVKANNYVIWEKNTTSVADAAAVAQKAKQFIEGKSLTLAATVVAGGVAEEVETGYYLLVPADGPCGVTLVEKDLTATVEEKTTATGHPTVEKLVKEDSVGTYGKQNDADIGQVIEFQTTITAGVNAEHYILHDKMVDYIAYTNAIVITRDGNPVADTDYTLVEDTGDECTFHIEFHDNLCTSLTKDAKLVVRYTGKLKEDAATETEHTNTTWLTYTAENVPSNESFTTTKTYKVTVNKVDNKANPLANAGFILRDNVGLYYHWNDVEKKVEWVALADEAAKQAAAVLTDSNGVVEFEGVDAEQFYLEEVIVPDGYTGTTDVSASTKSGTNVTVTVTNTLGTALPETGGIGTTVFYVLGGVLLVGALVALAVIKRKETSAQ